MALLKFNRTAQTVLLAEFVANFNDTAVDMSTLGVKSFGGAAVGENLAFVGVKLPGGTVIVGGEVIVEIAGVGPASYTIALSTTDGNTLLAATSVLATGRTPLTGLGLQANSGSDVVVTMNSTTAVATAGRFRVRVMYTVDRRANEVQTT
jgi:hypothetical protein